MAVEFNKKRFFDNITFLVKKNGLKIGEVEAAAGVSAGYISRMSKDVNNAKPGLEFAIGVAKVLGTSFDALISVDFSSLTPTEEYLVQFIEKLIRDTVDKDLPWIMESKVMLDSVGYDQNGPEHPLFDVMYRDVENENGGFDRCQEIGFDSRFNEYESICYVDDSFRLALTSDTTLYLMAIVLADKEGLVFGAVDYEMYIVKNGGVSPVCGTTVIKGNSPFEEILHNLYVAAKESSRHTKVNATVKNAIDWYMERGITSQNPSISELSADQLPF